MSSIRVILSNGDVEDFQDSSDQQFECESTADGHLTIFVREPWSVRPDSPSKEVAQYSAEQYESFEQREN